MELVLAQIRRGLNDIVQRASGVAPLYLLDHGQGVGRLSVRAPHAQVAAAIDLSASDGGVCAEVLPPASADDP